MNRIHLFCLSSYLVLFFSTSIFAAPISTFDNGFEGWTYTSGVSWQNYDGNPGGYLLFVDNGPADGGQLIAPASFLGDWSIYEGGTFSFDFKVFQTQSPTFNRALRISGPNGTAWWTGPNFAGPTDWITVVAPIVESEWNISSGDWFEILSDISEVRVYMPDSSSAIEHTGIDNIQLNAVPIPPAIFLLGSGLTGLVGLKIKKSNKSV